MSLPQISCKSLYATRYKPWSWVLIEPVKVTLSNGSPLVIPVGYVTDFATTPRVFRGIIPTCGNHNLAVLIHDWLCDYGTDRDFADREMLHWLRVTNVGMLKSYLMYSGVRVYSYWLKARKYLRKR